MAEYIERGGKFFPTPFRSEEHGDYRQGWNHCLRAIYQQSAADVMEVRHGHWEFEDYDYMPWCTKAICSSCKQTIANNADLSQDWGKRRFLKDNLFCAKCGAKMDGGQDE